MNSCLKCIAALSLFLCWSRGFQTFIPSTRATENRFSRPSRPFFQLWNARNDDNDPVVKSYQVRVLYENQSVDISVDENETILAALERHQLSDRLSLPYHMVPSDCRRGNCLTCTGTHTESSNLDSVVTDDGLAPHMSRWMQDQGFLLTCSSKVVGDGLELRLRENILAWEGMYKTRLEDDQARVLAWTAMARTKRESDERNVPRWTKETESVLKEGPSPKKQ